MPKLHFTPSVNQLSAFRSCGNRPFVNFPPPQRSWTGRMLRPLMFLCVPSEEGIKSCRKTLLSEHWSVTAQGGEVFISCLGASGFHQAWADTCTRRKGHSIALFTLLSSLVIISCCTEWTISPMSLMCAASYMYSRCNHRCVPTHIVSNRKIKESCVGLHSPALLQRNYGNP